MFMDDPAAQNSAVLWDYLKELRLMKRQVLDRMKQQNLDVLLGPVFPFPAPTLEDAEILISKPFNLILLAQPG